MFTVFSNRPKILSPLLNEYCKEYSKNYMRKLTEKSVNDKWCKPKLLLNTDMDTLFDNPKNPTDPDTIIPIICILSITSILLYFYNTKR